MWRVTQSFFQSGKGHFKSNNHYSNSLLLSIQFRFKSTHTPPTSFAKKVVDKPPRTAQPPPNLGPPRLVRHPSGSPDTHFNYTKAPVSRLFAYSSLGRGIERSGNTFSFSFPSTSYLSNRKAIKAVTEKGKPFIMAKSKGADASHKNGSALRKRTTGKGEEEASEKHDQYDSSSSSSWIPHMHTHSHSHSHSHAEGSAEEADRLLAALKGKGELCNFCFLFSILILSLKFLQAIEAATSQ